DYEQSPAGNLATMQTQAQRSDSATVIVVTRYRTPVPRTLREIRLPDGTSVRLVDAISAKSTCRPKHREVAPVGRLYAVRRGPSIALALWTSYWVARHCSASRSTWWGPGSVAAEGNGG